MPITQQSDNFDAVRKAVTQCELFKQLSDEQINEILRHSRQVTLRENEMLAEQSQQATEFFLTLSGELKLAATSSMGQEKILHIIHPGQTFAEVLMFLDKPKYPASISALRPSQVIAFPSKRYKTMLTNSISACFGLLGEYAIRNRNLVCEIEALTLHNATYRVVHYLLKNAPSDLYNATSIELNAPKHVIASRISITPETLSRILNKLKRDNIIEVSDKNITLLDIPWMQKFAENMCGEINAATKAV